MATHLADTSVLTRLHHDDVLARVGPLLVGGQVATTAVVDLELLGSARRGRDHASLLAERRLLPRAPCDDAAFDRALEVQGLLIERSDRDGGLAPLVVAAVAERAGLIVLHYDARFDRVAEITGQPCEWVVPRSSVP